MKNYYFQINRIVNKKFKSEVAFYKANNLKKAMEQLKFEYGNIFSLSCNDDGDIAEIFHEETKLRIKKITKKQYKKLYKKRTPKLVISPTPLIDNRKNRRK